MGGPRPPRPQAVRVGRGVGPRREQGTRLRLRDGRAVRLRTGQPADAQLLMDFHERLSPETRYTRYFQALRHLGRSEAEALASGADGVVVFMATAVEDGREAAVGTASLHPTAPRRAEFGFCVRDDYQGVGLGTLLLAAALEAAVALGLDQLHADTLTSNRRALGVLRAAGAVTETAGLEVVRLRLDARRCWGKTGDPRTPAA